MLSLPRPETRGGPADPAREGGAGVCGAGTCGGGAGESRSDTGVMVDPGSPPAVRKGLPSGPAVQTARIPNPLAGPFEGVAIDSGPGADAGPGLDA